MEDAALKNLQERWLGKDLRIGLAKGDN